MADYITKQFYGTATTVISHAAVLASAANTYTGLTACTMTEFDNSTNQYTNALAVLNVADTFAAAPTAGSTIDLYYTLNDIDSTNDETPVPAATDILYLATYAGSWVLDNQDVAVRKAIKISLLGVQKALFYIVNNSGQEISYSATPTTVKIVPFSLGVTG